MTCSFPFRHNSAFVFSPTGSRSKLCIGCMSGTLACHVRVFVCDICFSTRCREDEAISLLNNMSTCSIWLFQVSDSPCSLSRFPMPRKSVLLLVPAWAKAIADGGNCSAPSESAESSLLTLSKASHTYEVGTPYNRILGPCALHLRADRGVQKHHDGTVSTWKDSCGNEKNAVAGNKVPAPQKGGGMPVNMDSANGKKQGNGHFNINHAILEGGESKVHMFWNLSPGLTPGTGKPRWMSGAPLKEMILFEMGSPEQGPQLTLSFARRFRNNKRRQGSRRDRRVVCTNTWRVSFQGWTMANPKVSELCAPTRTTILELVIDFPAKRMSFRRRHEHHTPKSQSQQIQSTALLTEEALAEHNAKNADDPGRATSYSDASSSVSYPSEESTQSLPENGKIDSNVRQAWIGRRIASLIAQVEEESGFSGNVNEVIVYKDTLPPKNKDKALAAQRRKWVAKQKNLRCGSSLLQLSGQQPAQDGDDDEGLLPKLWFEADEAQAGVTDPTSIFLDSSGNENTLTPRLEGENSYPRYKDAPNTETPIRTLNFFNTPLGAERPVYGGIDGLEAWFVACFKAGEEVSEQDRFVFDMGEYAKQGYGCFMRTSRCTCYAANNMVTVNADMTKGCFMARFRAEFGDGTSLGTLSLVLNNEASLSAVIEAKDPNWPLLSLNSTTVDDAEGRKPFTIGRQSKDYKGGARWFPGFISEVQIFDRLLDDEEAGKVLTALQGKWNTTS